MKILKYLLFTIIGLTLIIFALSLVLPKSFHAEGTTEINRPIDEVFDYVKYIKNQENYGVWFKMDDNIQKKYSGTDGTVGFTYEWESEKVGNGKQVITKSIENERVEMDLYFEDSEDAAKSYISTESIDSNSTKVIWAIDGKMPIPFNVMGLFYDMNNDFIEGVKNLKEVLEK